jgi:hypothetical protein
MVQMSGIGEGDMVEASLVTGSNWPMVTTGSEEKQVRRCNSCFGELRDRSFGAATGTEQGDVGSAATDVHGGSWARKCQRGGVPGTVARA